jgi:hypothetical protein
LFLKKKVILSETSFNRFCTNFTATSDKTCPYINVYNAVDKTCKCHVTSNTKDLFIHNPDNIAIQVLSNNSNSALSQVTKTTGKLDLELILPDIHRQYVIKFYHLTDEEGKLILLYYIG